MNFLLSKLKNSSMELYNHLMIIKQNATAIHANRVLIDYTDHGIPHSERMIDLLISMCKDNVFSKKASKYGLNELEIFILLASIYLHDIGMQISEEKILRNFAKKNHIPYETSTQSAFIRGNHHLLSSYWIKCNLESNHTLTKAYSGDKELGQFVALVVESHGFDFINNPNYNRTDSYQGKSIRLNILCILLSLSDSLDCDCRRIDYNKIYYTEIQPSSQLHWLKHYYVNSVMIENNNIVKITYSFPELNEFESQIYKAYFSHKTSYWIKKNKEKFLDYLSAFNFVFEIQEIYEKSMTKEKLSPEIYANIETELVDIMDQYCDTSLPIPITSLRIAIGILKKDKKVLLVKRKEKEGNLLWQFPAGIIKPIESAEKIIIKEVKEETGITAEVEKSLGKRIHPNTKAICYYFALKYVGGEIQNGDESENADVIWESLDTYKERITSDLYINAEKYLSYC